MMRWGSAVGLGALLFSATVARAEEPVFRSWLLAQGQGEPRKPGDEPTDPSGKKPGDEPAGKKPGDEPTSGKPGDEPTSGKPGEEPSGKPASHEPGSVKPGEPAAREPAQVPVKPKSSVLYGAGFQVRGVFVPSWFLNAFLNASTPLNSVAIGGEFIRRKGNFDIVASINFGFYSPRDGNYMGKNKSYAEDVDYIQFRNLNLLAFDVAFIWHHDFTKWLSLVYGAGLGIGVVLGDIYRISNTNCTPENVNDATQCFPGEASNLDASRSAWLANREKYLTDHTGSKDDDAPGHPRLWRESGKWPVVPVVHLLLGVNFKITDHISVRVDGGFHNAFYCGATGQYFF